MLWSCLWLPYPSSTCNLSVVAGTVWKGFRLVCLFAVAGMEGLSDELRNKLTLNVWLSVKRNSCHAQVGGLAQALFGSLGSSATRLLHFCHFSCLESVYLFVDGVEGVLFHHSRHQVSSVNRSLPLCTWCVPSDFIVFYVAFLFLSSYRDELYVACLFLSSYRDESVVSRPVVLHLSVY